MKHEPAFPTTLDLDHPGMSLRDWFAGQALSALAGMYGTFDPDVISDWAYHLADEMLKRREARAANPPTDASQRLRR